MGFNDLENKAGGGIGGKKDKKKSRVDIEKLYGEAEKRLNIPKTEALSREEDIYKFPRFAASQQKLAEICQKLGAKLSLEGRSGFAKRNEYYIVVGTEANEENIAKAKDVIAEANEISKAEKMEGFWEEYDENSYDNGLSGYVITGGDPESLSSYGIKESVPGLIHVGDLRWGNTADHRQGKTHTEKSFFMDPSMVKDNQLTIKVRERDKYIFIGSGGSNLDRLKKELKVTDIRIQNPDYSPEVFDDFLEYATNESKVAKLPDRFSAWKDIYKANLQAIDQYYFLRIRSAGKLDPYGKEDMKMHYGSEMGRFRVVGMEQLCSLIRRKDLSILDISKELLSSEEEIEKNNPSEIEHSGVKFRINYGHNTRYIPDEENGSKSIEIFSASTDINQDQLEQDFLPEGLKLPNGRQVNLFCNVTIPEDYNSHKIEGNTTKELKDKLQELINKKFTDKINECIRTELNEPDILPIQISKHRDYYYNSALYKKLYDNSDKTANSEQLTKENFKEKLEIAKNNIKKKLQEIYAPLSEIVDKYQDLNNEVNNFFAGLTSEEEKLFVDEKNKFNNELQKIIAFLLELKNTEATITIETLAKNLADLKSNKEQLIKNRTADLENTIANVPEFIKSYYSGDMDRMIETTKELEFVRNKISRMNPTDFDYYRNELSVGKGRRYNAMEELMKGFSKDENYYSNLPRLAGNNKFNGVEFFLRTYLFDEYQDGGVYLETNTDNFQDDADNFENPDDIYENKSKLTTKVNLEDMDDLSKLRSGYALADDFMAKAMLKGQLLTALKLARDKETNPDKNKALTDEINRIKKE